MPRTSATTSLLQLVALMLPVVIIAFRLYVENVPQEDRTLHYRESGREGISHEEVAQVFRFGWYTVAFLVAAAFCLSIQVVVLLTPAVLLWLAVGFLLLAFASFGITVYYIYEDMIRNGVVDYGN